MFDSTEYGPKRIVMGEDEEFNVGTIKIKDNVHLCRIDSEIKLYNV